MRASLFGSVTDSAKAWAARRTIRLSAEKRLYSAVAVMQNLESRQLLSAVNPFPGPTLVSPEVLKNLSGHDEAPFAVAVGDLNGDGIPDVVTANHNGTITIMTQYSDQNGRGTGELFYLDSPPSIYGTFSDGLGSGEGNAHDLAIGNLPNGNPVIAVANGSDRISLIVGDGHGAFKSAYTVYAASGGVDGLTFVNDNLGIADSNTGLITANHDGSISLIDDVYGSGGAFLASNEFFGSGASLFSPEEINNGAYHDGLALLDSNGNLLEIDNTGQTSTIEQHVESFAVGSFNSPSGYSDIVALSTFASSQQTIKSYIGGGSEPTLHGELTLASTTTSASNLGQSIKLADLNGDGKLDAVVTKYDSTGLGTVSLTGFVGTGGGHFPSTFAAYAVTAFGNDSTQYVDSVALADMNGDGKADLVFGYYNFHNHNGPVGVRLNNDEDVPSVPTITSPDIAFFNSGSNDSFEITTTGAKAATITYTGELPSGITFTGDENGTASITGNPGTYYGIYNLTINAHNGAGSATPQPFILDVLAPTTFDVLQGATAQSEAILPGGYSDSVTFWNSGALPADGIALTGNAATGYDLKTDQGGVTTPAGQYLVDLSFSNGVNPPVIQEITLDVIAPVIFTSPDNVSFAKGHYGSFTITTNSFPVPGSDIALTLLAGELPPGMNFVDNGNGTATIYGTPTGNVSHFGITVNAEDFVNLGVPFVAGFKPAITVRPDDVFLDVPDSQQSISITVQSKTKPVVTSPDPTFQVGTPAYYEITTSGYPSVPLGDLNVSGLPAGLTFTDLGNGTGTITGTPTEVGTYNLTVTATNSAGTTHQTLKLIIAQPIVVTSADNTEFEKGNNSDFFVTCTGYPFADITVLGNLPPGISLRSEGDDESVLTGKPTKTGVYHFTLAFAGGPNDTDRVLQAFTLTVEPPI
jgi:hypothetical protein